MIKKTVELHTTFEIIPDAAGGELSTAGVGGREPSWRLDGENGILVPFRLHTHRAGAWKLKGVNKIRAVCACSVLAVLLATDAFSQNTVPTVDGGAGPCTVELTATGPNGAPVNNAQIRVHISYGFLGSHQLDLQVATDAHGKARFIGLPESVDGGLFFEASTDTLTGVATDDPNAECHAQHALYMGKKKPAEAPAK